MLDPQRLPPDDLRLWNADRVRVALGTRARWTLLPGTRPEDPPRLAAIFTLPSSGRVPDGDR